MNSRKYGTIISTVLGVLLALLTILSSGYHFAVRIDILEKEYQELDREVEGLWAAHDNLRDEVVDILLQGKFNNDK